MTEFVPGTHPDFDTDSDGRAVAFRDRGGQHHGLVTYQAGPGGGIEYPGIRGAGDFSVGSTYRRSARSTHAIHQYLKDIIRRAKGGRVATMGAAPISFRCDHGMDDFFTSFFPLFEARGIPVTMGLVTEAIGDPAHRYEPCNLTWAQIRDYHHRGVSMWSHSRSHTDPFVTAQSEGRSVDEVLEREIALSKLEMLQNNIVPIGWQQPGITPCYCEQYSSNFFAPDSWDSLPGQLILENYGINEMTALERRHDGTNIGVGGKYRWLPTDGANDLGHFTLDGMTYAQAVAAIDNAVAWGVGVQFMWHPKFVMAGTTAWKLADMTNLLDYVVTLRDQGKLMPLTAEGLAFADIDATKRKNLMAEEFFESGVVPGGAGSRWLRSGVTSVPLTIAQDGTGQYIVTQPSTAAGYIYQGVGTSADHRIHGHAFSIEVECRNTAQTVASQIQISVYIDNVLIPGVSRLQTIAADSQWKTLRQIFCVPVGAAIVQVRVSRPVGDGNIEYRRIGVHPI